MNRSDRSLSIFGGRLDILVNNAGVAPGNRAEDVPEADFDFTLAVNLKGTFFACQAAGRVMIRQKSGRIINMSSQAGFAALPSESVYCMTKAGIAHLTKCLAVERGPHNITVNAVAPTFSHMPGTEAALADSSFRADVIDRIAALHRIGEPMEVAGAVVFLASPAAFFFIPSRCHRSHCRASSNWRAHGGSGRSRLPRLARCVSHHRTHLAHRRGLDSTIVYCLGRTMARGVYWLFCCPPRHF